jgi:enoyl-CoA hydratase/carnithine racemase
LRCFSAAAVKRCAFLPCQSRSIRASHLGIVDDADAVSQATVEVEDRIAALVPTSPAGAAAQLRLLRQWGRDYEWNEPLEELADKLLAGLERIGEAQL